MPKCWGKGRGGRTSCANWTRRSMICGGLLPLGEHMPPTNLEVHCSASFPNWTPALAPRDSPKIPPRAWHAKGNLGVVGEFETSKGDGCSGRDWCQSVMGA